MIFHTVDPKAECLIFDLEAELDEAATDPDFLPNFTYATKCPWLGKWAGFWMPKPKAT